MDWDALWPSRNQGRSVRILRVACAKEISGCISNKGFCSCCSATFRRAELWQKCTLRTLRSPEELNVVILGKKLYQGGCWIATHVQTLQKQYSWCQSFALTAQIEKCHSACIVRRFLVPEKFAGWHVWNHARRNSKNWKRLHKTCDGLPKKKSGNCVGIAKSLSRAQSFEDECKQLLVVLMARMTCTKRYVTVHSVVFNLCALAWVVCQDFSHATPLLAQNSAQFQLSVYKFGIWY